MSTPNPLQPQGTLQSQGKSNVRIAFFTIAAIHLVIIGVFLIVGCRRETQPTTPPPAEPANDFGSLPAYPDDIFLPDPEPVQPDTNQAASTLPPPDYAQPVFADPVPEQPPLEQTREHVIVRGDMLSTIAAKYGVTVRAIEEANPGVDPLRLQIGRTLHIPAPGRTPGVSATPTITAEGENIYVVQAGDNLTKIAAKYGTTVNAIKNLNGLRTDQIKVGDKLRIPSSGASLR